MLSSSGCAIIDSLKGKDKLISEDDFSRLFIDHPLYELNPQNFSLQIEKLVKDQGLDYLEATVALCEQYEIEYSYAAKKLISSTMKDKIEVDSMAKNRFRKHKPAPVEAYVPEFEEVEENA